MAVLFYTHEKELSNWVDDLRQELQSDESIAESLEATERLLEQTAQHRDQSLDACASTIAQGEALLQELRWVKSESFQLEFCFYISSFIVLHIKEYPH